MICYKGGLRSCEAKSLEIRDVTILENEIKIAYSHAKQRGPKSSTFFVISFDKQNPRLCFARHVTAYLDALKEKLGKNVTGRLFRGTYGGTTFLRTPMGHNYLSVVGKDLANAMGFENPDQFSGHCFRYVAFVFFASH